MPRLRTLLLLLALVAGWVSLSPHHFVFAANNFVLDDFDGPSFKSNRLGIKYSVYENNPSTANIKRVDTDRNKSLLITFNKKEEGWCGFYSLLYKDTQYFNASNYKAVSFFVKGKDGKETFDIGIADKKWQIKGDSLKAGPVDYYLPGGVTTSWQRVTIPLVDFGDLDLSQLGSLVFNFYKPGQGQIFVDDITFQTDLSGVKKAEKAGGSKGVIDVDNFNYEKNLFGSINNAYERKPSNATVTRIALPESPAQGNVLKITYQKSNEGWCGYYTVLHKLGQPYLDASQAEAIYFKVKGTKGGELFDVGMADQVWDQKGDSLKAGPITFFTPKGVTTSWQEVVIPLKAFGNLDFSKAHAFVINFYDEQSGTIYVDDIALLSKDAIAAKGLKLPALGSKGKVDDKSFLVDDFNYTQNNLSGLTNAYKREPSTATLNYIKEKEENILRIDFTKKEEGWCGYYTLLYQLGSEAYFDGTPYKYITFKVKGKKGEELFEVGMADKTWDRRGDSLKAGFITDYLPKGVTTSWQTAKIPLENFGDLVYSELASFVMNFPVEGEGSIYIDKVTFTKE